MISIYHVRSYAGLLLLVISTTLFLFFHFCYKKSLGQEIVQGFLVGVKIHKRH